MIKCSVIWDIFLSSETHAVIWFLVGVCPFEKKSHITWVIWDCMWKTCESAFQQMMSLRLRMWALADVWHNVNNMREIKRCVKIYESWGKINESWEINESHMTINTLWNEMNRAKGRTWQIKETRTECENSLKVPKHHASISHVNRVIAHMWGLCVFSFASVNRRSRNCANYCTWLDHPSISKYLHTISCQYCCVGFVHVFHKQRLPGQALK